MALQQILRSLCFNTGWCYAVFWKLKRRSRMVLTWEDGYYEYSKSALSDWSPVPTPLDPRLRHENCGSDTGRNPRDQGCSEHDASYAEGQIGLAVAKMSYCVYSMGEGIIGRVAFTGKHQWIFGSRENDYLEAAPRGIMNNPCLLEKYLAGWKNQFTAGIKTIAVIAVPQGVVQLGSIEMIMEDVKWVDHIKSVFGTLQNVPGAFLSDLVLDGKGKSTLSTAAMSGSSTGVERFSSFNQGQYFLKKVKGVNDSTVQSLGCGSKGRPKLVQSILNFQGLHPVAEATEAATAMLRESNLQKVIEMGMEAEGFKSAKTKVSSQTSQSFSHALQLDVPSVSNKKFRVPSDMGSCFDEHIEERKPKKTKVNQNHQLLSMASVGNIGSDVDADQSTGCGCENDANVKVGHDIEQIAINGMDVPECPFDIKQDNGLLGFSCVNGSVKVTPSSELIAFDGRKAGVSVLTNVYSAPQNCSLAQAACISSSRLPKYDVSDQLCNFYSFEDNISIQECSKDATQTVASPSISSAKLFHSSPFGGVRNAAADHDSLCYIAGHHAWGRKDLGRSISSCVSPQSISNLEHVKHSYKDLESSFGNMGNKNIVTSGLDDFEMYLASLSRGQRGNWDGPFAIGDELSQALGPTFRTGHDREFWEQILLLSDADQNQHASCGLLEQSKAEVIQELGSTFIKDVNKKAGRLHLSDSKSVPLLDAMIQNASSSHNAVPTNINEFFCSKNPFSGLDIGKPILNTLEVPDPKCATCNNSHEYPTEGCMKTVSDCFLVPKNAQNINQVHNAQMHLNFHVSNDSSLKMMMSSWAGEGQSTGFYNSQSSLLKKPDDLAKASRKRAKSGDSTRPRPKDRQQIQDRVRELREIIPSGSKCSIDALLEKTIKHLLFLQSVTLHADKLKKDGIWKVSSDNNNLQTQDDMESGASWALDLGGQEMGCPILVKNLNQPRQMLVEMMCEERGVFLEIADIIRSLGFTILKGIMESRTNKIWARFAVEAKRDVHRVEIVLSLMRLLPLENSSCCSSMTVASQSGSIRPRQGIDCNSSQTLCGIKTSCSAGF